MNQRDDLLVWIDCEMTSLLDPAIDSITQIACIITDKDLNIVAESEEITIHADQKRFDEVPEDVRKFHQDMGLVPSIVASTITEEQAEQSILDLVAAHTTAGSAPMCGNTIHMDRMFIRTRMPKLNAHLHYRNIDVSTIKELARRWRPELYADVARMKANKNHHALDDIRGSIEELKFYRSSWLK